MEPCQVHAKLNVPSRQNVLISGLPTGLSVCHRAVNGTCISGFTVDFTPKTGQGLPPTSRVQWGRDGRERKWALFVDTLTSISSPVSLCCLGLSWLSLFPNSSVVFFSRLGRRCSLHKILWKVKVHVVLSVSKCCGCQFLQPPFQHRACPPLPSFGWDCS